MRCLGVDPGKSGFLCLLSDGEPQFWPTPTILIGKGGKREYDVAAMRATLVAWEPDLVVIERQQAMPTDLHGRKQGTASSFATGYGYGLWVGLVSGLGLPMIAPHPRTWQARLHRDIPGDSTKARSIIAAGRLFPTVDLRATERCRVPHDGKADALLLAYYGAITRNELQEN
jgi:hypothetical protein